MQTASLDFEINVVHIVTGAKVGEDWQQIGYSILMFSDIDKIKQAIDA